MKRLLIAFLLIGSCGAQAQMLVGAGPRLQPNYILPTFQRPGMMMGPNPVLQNQMPYGFGVNPIFPSRYPMPLMTMMSQPLAYSQALQPPGLIRPINFQAPMGPMGMPPYGAPMMPMGGFMPMMTPISNGGFGIAPGGAYNSIGSSYCPSCNLRRERMTDPIVEPQTAPAPIAQQDVFTEAGTRAMPPPAQRTTSTDRVATVDDSNVESVAAPLPTSKIAAVSVSRPASQHVAGRMTSARRPQTRTPGLSPRRKVELSPAELIGVRARTRDEVNAQGAPVWKPFMANFAVCAPGCVPWDYAAYGERNNRSCHPSGRALDIHGMVCNGRLYKAIDQGRFSEMMACMHKRMYTIYHNKPYSRATVTSGHWDHGHFSLACNVNGALVW